MSSIALAAEDPVQANAPRNNVSHTDINKGLAKSHGTILRNKDCICVTVSAHSFECAVGSGTLQGAELMYAMAVDCSRVGVEVVCLFQLSFCDAGAQVFGLRVHWSLHF